MAVNFKKPKKESQRLTTRERLLQRKEDFEKKKSFGDMIFLKEGVTRRVRLRSAGQDSDLAIELIRFYLGSKLGYVTSAATFGQPCPFMEKYTELKNSKDPEDQILAGKLRPSSKFLIGVIAYKDEKGKEIDSDGIDKGMIIPRSVYQDIIEYYLDEDEWGDMTDLESGYDLKISRVGSGKNDTSYSVVPCPGRKPLPKEYRHTMDLNKLVKSQIKTYDEQEEILDRWLNGVSDDDDDSGDTTKSKKSFKKLRRSDD